jgi:hypothetical protein
VAEVHIFDIEMLRDGGTTFFKVEQCGWITNVRLDTPFHGDPRKLEINFARVKRGQPEVAMLIEQIDGWWSNLDAPTQAKALALLAQEGPYKNLTPDLLKIVDLTNVLRVRDYMRQNYLR